MVKKFAARVAAEVCHALLCPIVKTNSKELAHKSWLLWRDEGDGTYAVTGLALVNTALYPLHVMMVIDPKAVEEVRNHGRQAEQGHAR